MLSSTIINLFGPWSVWMRALDHSTTSPFSFDHFSTNTSWCSYSTLHALFRLKLTWDFAYSSYILYTRQLAIRSGWRILLIDAYTHKVTRWWLIRATENPNGKNKNHLHIFLIDDEIESNRANNVSTFHFPFIRSVVNDDASSSYIYMYTYRHLIWCYFSTSILYEMIRLHHFGYFFFFILLQCHKTSIRERIKHEFELYTKSMCINVCVYMYGFCCLLHIVFLRLWLASTITDHYELLLIHIRTDTCTSKPNKRKRQSKNNN